MPNDVAVVFVHGIFVSDQDYAKVMQERIRRKLPKALRKHVTFGSVFWANAVRLRQQQYYDQATERNALAPSQLRRLVIEGLGDAAAYQKTRLRKNSAYYTIQKALRTTLNELDAKGDPARPLILVGHSLGCHILSSYIWDVHKIKQLSDEEVALQDKGTQKFCTVLRSASAFRRLGTVAGIVTMGSNMPLFTFTFGPKNVFPITHAHAEGKHPGFPGSELKPSVRDKARWLNFFSRKDVLGYPLKPLNDAYNNEVRIEDIPVRSEGLLSSLLMPSPIDAVAAHTGYWRNGNVIRKTARLVRDIIEA